ncbi:MAG TPA: hypothetical protein VIM42_01050 [Clostridium sp.]|uniref:hypothetical protein n=1 Tax=Clostridium algoriphilum TaxID=198347 RepID=UPI001CF135A4|nr:hypothetical protein [Clostridium algoriphilum]MCB2292429.1 hypothetical protein [Clostridium algoriphilum]
MENNVETKVGKKVEKNKAVKIVVIIVLLAVIIGGGIFYQNAKAEKAKKAEAIYNIELQQVMLLASIQGAKIETDAQEIASVWHSAIFSAPVTVNGKPAYDFDDAIQYKNEEFKANGEMDAIIEGKAEMQKHMDALVNPSIENKEAYELVMKIFTTYNEFEGMVESPNGSLTDYNQKYSTLDNSLASQIKEFQTRYPSK